MDKESKLSVYRSVIENLSNALEGETNLITLMAAVNSELKNNFPHFFWVGFYIVDNGSLIVGPYQGTFGCIHISFDRGVCGRAARTQQIQIVEDVHSDPEHIACDSRTNSEIVLPVFNNGKLIAVLDIDSTEIAAFDLVDAEQLKHITEKFFNQREIVAGWKW